VKRLAVFQNEPFRIPYSRMNHLCYDWKKRMLTTVQNTFYNHCARWLPLVNERFVINKMVAISIIVTNDAAKPDCILPTGDNCSLNDSCSSSKLIVIKINETLLSRKQQLCQKCEHRKSMKPCSQGSSDPVKNENTGNHTLISQTQIQRKFLLGFLY
jgi:hypothetical protein